MTIRRALAPPVGAGGPAKQLRMVSLDAPEIAKFQLPRAAPPYPTGPPCSPHRTATFGRGSCPAVAWCRRSCLRPVGAGGPAKQLRMVSLDAPEIAKFQLPRAAPPYPTGPPCSPHRTATFGRGSCPAVAWCRRSCLRPVGAGGPTKQLRMVSLDAPRIAEFQLPRAAPLYPTGPPCPPSRTATFGRGSCPAVAWCRLSCLRSSRALGASHLLAVPSFVLPSCRSLAPPPCGAPPRQKVNVLIGLDAPLSRLWSCCTRSPAVYVARAPPYEARPPSNPVWLRLRVACAVRAGMRNGTAQTVGSALDGDL